MNDITRQVSKILFCNVFPFFNSIFFNFYLYVLCVWFPSNLGLKRKRKYSRKKIFYKTLDKEQR